MIIASYVFLGLFGLVSLINIYFAFVENEKWRKITKPFCLTFLIIAAILYKPNAPLIYVGALFGLAGDIFLLWQKNKWCFMGGIVTFLIGHFFYLAQIITTLDGEPLPWQTYVIAAAIFVVAAICLFPLAKKITKKTPIAALCSLYGPTLLLLLTAGIYMACHNQNHVSGILISIGYIFFIISDGTILFTSFVKKDVKKKHFYIMSTYLVAQLLIVLGFLLF